MKPIKTFFGLMGFTVVVALSFLVVNDVVKSPIIHVAEVPIVAEYNHYVTAPPAFLMPPPQEPAGNEPLPRFIVSEAEYYIAAQGYEFTVFVEFGEYRLSFHLAEGVDINYAMVTISQIVDVFDIAYESFAGWPFLDYFIVGGPGDVLNRQIYYNFASEPTAGLITYLYFSQVLRYPLPKWLSVGLEGYMLGCDEVSLLPEDELSELLQSGTGTLPFGDAWFVPTLLGARGAASEIPDISYTIVRRWSEAGTLHDLVSLAQTDTRAFAVSANAYIAALAESTDISTLQFIYRFSDIKVITQHAGYIFIDDNYEWTWPRVTNFIAYMDAAIEFIREYFQINDTGHIRVTLYPFGVINIPDSIAGMAYAFGWDAPDVNFVTNDEIVLASTSRFGTWAMSHEAVHILLFREFAGYNPPTWMVEGMAVLGELLFRDAFTGTRTYRFSVPTVSNIDALARNGAGHRLPFHYTEANFGRYNWTYDDAGSFLLYLYNNFGIEALLAMYRSDNYSQFEMALELFGMELEELIYSWRGFLWPNGEPAGWW